MQQWEYEVVTVSVIDIGDIIKHKNKRPNLDPKINDAEWMRLTWKWGRQDIARVAWSKRECWTKYSTCLAEYGDDGWELVGTTPALETWVASGNVDRYEARYPTFWLTFKRRKS